MIRKAYDEEALFGHTRMSLGDHIEELRTVLWRAIKGFALAMIIGFFVARSALGFLIAPLHHVLRDMDIDHLKKDQEKALDTDVRKATALRVRKGDLATALHQSQGEEAADSYMITMTDVNGTEVQQSVHADELQSAVQKASAKSGGDWVILPFHTPKEVARRYLVRRAELCDALNMPKPTAGPEWVGLTLHSDQDLEIRRLVSKEDLQSLDSAAARESSKAVTLFDVTSEDDDIAHKIKAAESLRTNDVIMALGITEPFMIWFKVSMYAGFVIASPWIFFQLWMFIGAGLYPHEKKYIHVFMPLSLCLFIAGVCLCQFVVLPMGIRWLLEFSEWLGVRSDLRLSEWFSFALLVPIIFGIAFQLPVAMFGLERVGIFTVDTYRSKRRIAIFLIFLISGMANASPDPISMTMLALPLCVLYELGIWLCRWWPREELDLDVEETEEMVEV